MAEKQPQSSRVFGGDRMRWISPLTLKYLLEAKVKYPQARSSWGTPLQVCRTPRTSYEDTWKECVGGKNLKYASPRKIVPIPPWLPLPCEEHCHNCPYVSQFLLPLTGAVPQLHPGGLSHNQSGAAVPWWLSSFPVETDQGLVFEMVLCFLSQWYLSRWMLQL